MLVYEITIFPVLLAYFPDVEVYADLVVDCFFILDIVFCYSIPYMNRLGVMVYNKRKIAVKYWKTWVFVDTVALIPFCLTVAWLASGETVSYSAYWQLLRILRVIKIVRASRFTNNFLDQLEDRTKPQIAKTIRLLLVILAIVHMVSCMWFFVGTHDLNVDNAETWVTRLWNANDHDFLAHENTLYKYIVSFYWYVLVLPVCLTAFSVLSPFSFSLCFLVRCRLSYLAVLVVFFSSL